MQRDERVVSLDSVRAESLLVYLLLYRDGAHPRQRLAFLLWPDSSEAQARTNLRHLLHTLRRRLLMRLHDAGGDRVRALRVYHLCSSTLERELGVDPSPETRAAYEALLPDEPDAAPETAARAGGPPLIERVPERARLAAAWRSTDAGRAQFVLVSGEPGVGKTRLVDEFRAWCARRGAATAVAVCHPAEGPLAYGPVAAWLRCDAMRPRLVRLNRARVIELARLLPELLVEVPDLKRPTLMPERDQRHRLFDAVAAAVLSSGGPGLLVIEDVQQGDLETFGSCTTCYGSGHHEQARLLVVATARREEFDGNHPVHGLLTGLHARRRLKEIELARLSRGETAVLAERLAGAALEEPRRAAALRRDGGQPALRGRSRAGRLGELWRRRIVREQGTDLRLQPRQDPRGRLPLRQPGPAAATAPADRAGAGAAEHGAPALRARRRAVPSGGPPRTPDPLRPGPEGGLPEPPGQHAVLPGCPDEARSARSAALAWAEEIEHPYSRAAALMFAALFERETDVIDAAVEAGMRILDGLGATPAATWVRRRLKELGVKRVPRGALPMTRSHPAGLTQRQVDVLALLPTGMTNAEIAQRLVVSVRTVEHHISAILGKLGVPTRRKAAAAAVSLGVRRH